MPSLLVGGRRLELRGLAKNKPLADLSQKRITKAARDRLRTAYGRERIVCSCEANIVVDGVWQGRCKIKGQGYIYTIEE